MNREPRNVDRAQIASIHDSCRFSTRSLRAGFSWSRRTLHTLVGVLVLLSALLGQARPLVAQGADESGPVVPLPAPKAPKSVGSDESSIPPLTPVPPSPTPSLPRSTDLPGPTTEPEPRWNEGGHSYDFDVVNPLRYLDLGIDFTMTEFNRGLNSLISQLDESDSNHIRAFGRFRWRWQDANNPTLAPNLRDHDVRMYEAWRVGAALTLDVLEFNVSVQHVLGRRTDIGEDLWDIHTLNVTITGFEGEAIRVPLELLNTYLRVVGYVGRGPLTFGRGRLIGSEDWDFAGNNFDAVALGLVDSATGGGLSLFGLQRVRYERRKFNTADYGNYLFGIAIVGLDPFGQGPPVEDQIARVLLRRNDFDTAWFPLINPRERRLLAGFDLYGILHYSTDVDFIGEFSPTINGLPHGRKNFWSLGMRLGVLFETIITLEAEAVVQIGKKAGNPVVAYMVHGEVTLGVDWALPFSLTVALDIGSGDNDPQDGIQQGFDPLMPLTHNRFGLLDFFGIRNLLHFGTTFRVQAGNAFAVFISGHYFRSLTSNDGVYNSTNQVLLAPTGGSEVRDLGVMLCSGVEYRYSPRVHLYFGVAQLFLGARFTRRGLNADPSVIYFSTELRF